MTIMRTPDLNAVHHPVVARELTKQAEDLHIVVFAVWMLVLEREPWPTLTLVVSLEAIFLSTFVMIGQNRQAAFQQQKADHDFVAQEEELHVNTQLTRQVERLTREIHGAVVGTGSGPGSGQA